MIAMVQKLLKFFMKKNCKEQIKKNLELKRKYNKRKQAIS